MGLITTLQLPEGALNATCSNTGASLLSMSQQQAVMLIFLRHFGCLFCREALADLGRVKAELEARGVRIAIAHLHTEEEAQAFLPRYQLGDVPRISDPDRGLFRAFGLQDGSLLQIFGPRVLARAVGASLRGLPAGPMSEEIRQMPGVFLLRSGRVVGGFVHDRISDRPDYRGLADNAGGDFGGGS